ncbi:MAG: PLP-dependent aminotransferase family protein [Gemmatimonadota bacterium]
MPKRSGGPSIPLLREPRTETGRPLYRRLYRRIREAILRGAIPPGSRLPSARTMAREEGISRNTVEAAMRQLRAEGFVVRRVGSGTWVAEDLPERLLRPKAEAVSRERESVGGGSPGLSARGRRVADAGGEPAFPRGQIFAPCVPAVEAIPLEGWKRIVARHARRRSSALLTPPPEGLPMLREAVAGYLHMNRGVRCGPEQVVIVDSTQQAISLVCRMLLDPGDEVWMEDPGYRPARRAFVACGARPVPVPVDGDGMNVERGIRRAPGARLAYVTPSHQYPMGVTLSLARRLELLEWAERADAWVLEDDYDSELRHDGRPLASVQGVDTRGRVIYAGTFNKILFPSLRIGYLVLPEGLVEPFARAKELADGFTAPLFQAVLAEFIHEGHFAAHLRRVREVYRKRRDAFVSRAGHDLPAPARLGSTDAGMHCVVRLPDGVDDASISDRARRRGVASPALSRYCMVDARRGVLVHYGNAPVPEIERGIGILANVLNAALD